VFILQQARKWRKLIVKFASLSKNVFKHKKKQKTNNFHMQAEKPLYNRNI